MAPTSTAACEGKIDPIGLEVGSNLTYSRLQEHANISGYYFGSKLNQAVGPSFFAADGTPTCGTPAAPIRGCTPVNLFNQFANSPAALSGISANYNTDYVYTYKAAALDLNGKVITLPAGDLLAALGVEYNDRRGNLLTVDALVQALPPLFLTADCRRRPVPATAIGQYNSKQEYLELFIPILKDLPIGSTP